ncbi:probable 18S rRNA (guanine-N(7))-methyltransferase [Sycon ciliatum]|uniref:probable 18S rRNA (guanine-N(7))-methyltransferase n=1 Tax=Sycon ciliatum TaxID=27933 RepID=UPI0020AC7DA9|eukprot:scpid67837/ scgid28896/ Uncharacterized methyltransferase WBSCR22; Williams-Beuren syndrome chromosomal region 22 protein homolog
MSRPEHTGPPELFYNEDEATKYTCNSRIIEIQEKMTERAVEMLALPPDQPAFLLDVGCGSGLSGEWLTAEGHHWIGVDISEHMLNVAKEREVEGEVCLGDAGEGMFFRPGVFDGVVSISALQWLCNADKKDHRPAQRLHHFFTTLYSCMARGSKAVFQFYPENPSQMELITSQAMRAGFTGGVVVDYPHSTKAKKYYLCLFCGTPARMPSALDGASGQGQEGGVQYTTERERIRKRKGDRTPLKSRDWIVRKKERSRRQGKEVRRDTKYTGRKRAPKF